MKPELHIHNISKTYGTKRVLKDLTLSGSGGEVLGIIGGNGSGKSTLLRIIAGLQRPSAGSISLRIGDIQIQEAVQRRKYIGYVSPDVMFYPELSARENLAFFAKVGGHDRPIDALYSLIAMVGLTRDREAPVGTFSSGMKQRLRLALALLPDAPLLLLDEPTLALDTVGVGVVEESIHQYRNKGALVLLATNDPDETRWADRLIRVGATFPAGERRGLGD